MNNQTNKHVSNNNKEPNPADLVKELEKMPPAKLEKTLKEMSEVLDKAIKTMKDRNQRNEAINKSDVKQVDSAILSQINLNTNH